MDRNVILALVLSMGLFLGYDILVLGPKREAYQAAEAERQAAAAEQMDPADAGQTFFPGTEEAETREEALTQAPARVPIRTETLSGSINLRGLFFDDLTLLNYNATLDEESPNIVLLSPRSAPNAQFMRAGMSIQTDLATPGDLGANSIWEAPEGAVLTPTSPVTFTRDVNGVTHEITISVDDQFLFTVDQQVTNNSSNPIRTTPIGATFQKGVPTDLRNMMILFEGPMAVINQGNRDILDRKYKKILNNGGLSGNGTGGWVGITDKYWLSAAIPPQDAAFKAEIAATNDATPLFASTYTLDPVVLQPGDSTQTSSHLYGGSKKVRILRAYEEELGVDRFDWAVDWGNFAFLTRPIFNALSFFHGYVGNWGVAILLLTVLIKLILFPLANLSYKSMAGMKMVQPELTKVRERYADDKMKQQQEMMALYKKHKINPAAGCLPILAQMPIFYALYKTLFVTIELRHEPFLYIKDLSERD
ncbi:MAG: membrane protein insertase YidC, partial [Pseudomonadota bacterium]